MPTRAHLLLTPLLTLLPALAAGLPAAGSAPDPACRASQEVSADPLAELASLTRAVGRATEPDPPEVLAAELLFHDLRLLWVGQENRRKEILAGSAAWVGTIEERSFRGVAGLVEGRSVERVVDWMGPRLDAELVGWLGRELALVSSEATPAQRVGALRLLAASSESAARMALFAGTRDPDRLARDTALAGLVGRDDQAVHTLLIDLLADAEAGELAIHKGTIEGHFRGARIERADAAFARVLVHVRRRLTAEDWRRASRAIAIGRCLPDEVLLGPLIEALPVWMERGAAGLQAKRIQGDLLEELERRTGRRLGLHPERWRTLFEAVRNGDLELGGESADGDRPRTAASFFGLRPWTDRVTFVIDRSGSMDQDFTDPNAEGGTDATTSRYSAAIRQLTAFLEDLGEETRFDVVLFSGGAARWRRELVPATPDNLRAVAAWAVAAETGGGTHLRDGIELAARLKSDGTIDLAKLEADTVIVLCDGDTDEGPSWIGPFLRGVNDEARLRFHAVQIGGSGDGSLRALCEGSGGDYLSVGE